MPRSALEAPQTDPTPIFEAFRGSYGSQLLTVAVAHLRFFDRMADGGKTLAQLQDITGLEARPLIVLTTALRALGLLDQNAASEFELTPISREHLTDGSPFNVSDYIGLASESGDVQFMVERLMSNRPAGADDEEGAAFIFREGMDSAMEAEQTARYFTLALAGRAKNVAPALAQNLPMEGVTNLLDVAGGTGIYSIALLQQHPSLRAVVLDRPEVLKVAAEMAAEYGVKDRLELVAGDMFVDALPTGCEAILLSNVLHDWDVPECRRLVERCANALPAGGRLLIHDVFLNDALDGPLPIALYSAALFTLTEGRAYSCAEYTEWLQASGLMPAPIIPTLVHCAVLTGTKPA